MERAHRETQHGRPYIELEERLPHKDVGAYAELLEHHSRPIFSYLRRLVRDPELARDVYGEAVARGLKIVMEGRFRSKGNFRGWMMRIGRNHYFDQRRRRRRESPLVAADQSVKGVGGPGQANAAVELQRVVESIDKMTGKARAVAHRYFLQGWSAREIAVSLNITENSVRGHIKRSKKTLKKIVEQEVED